VTCTVNLILLSWEPLDAVQKEIAWLRVVQQVPEESHDRRNNVIAPDMETRSMKPKIQ
jgi:hypothetical protein